MEREIAPANEDGKPTITSESAGPIPRAVITINVIADGLADLERAVGRLAQVAITVSPVIATRLHLDKNANQAIIHPRF
jgi:hypothetical protein